MVRASQCRNDPTGLGQGVELPHAGDSAVIDPDGRTVLEASWHEAVLVADVDASVVAAQRDRLPFLTDRHTL